MNRPDDATFEKTGKDAISSKHDLFVFKRKNVDQFEFVNAKSVGNFDEQEDEDLKESKETGVSQ